MRRLLVSIVLLSVVLLTGCGGSGSPPPPPAPTVNSVTLSPASTSILIKGTQQLTATVQGSGNFNPAINWYVNDVQGGNSAVGTVTASGLFTAPNSVPNPASVMVRAQSVQDTAKFASAQVTISSENVQISISPSSASMQLTTAQRFTATVTGTVNTAVSWSVNNLVGGNAQTGIVDSTGYYTSPGQLLAPNTITVTATSLEDPSLSLPQRRVQLSHVPK